MHKDAVNVLLPQISADLDMTVADLRALSERFADTGFGDLVELPDDAPRRPHPLDVSDAESGVLSVHGDGLSSDRVRKIAEAILEG